MLSSLRRRKLTQKRKVLESDRQMQCRKRTLNTENEIKAAETTAAEAEAVGEEAKEETEQ